MWGWGCSIFGWVRGGCGCFGKVVGLGGARLRRGIEGGTVGDVVDEMRGWICIVSGLVNDGADKEVINL